MKTRGTTDTAIGTIRPRREIRPSLPRQTARLIYNAMRSLLTFVSPRLNTQLVHVVTKHCFMDLRQPSTLDEKLSWLKLNVYNHDPRVRDCSDKVLVREYVRSQGLHHILNDVYAVYATVDDVPWNDLPSQFVLKWNNGCGGHIICHDLEQLDENHARRALERSRRARTHLRNSELQYRDIRPLLICERLINGTGGAPPLDYKVYCFHGEPVCVLVCVGRSGAEHTAFYFFDLNWKLLAINSWSKNPPYDPLLSRPSRLDEAVEYARRLSKPFPFVRVDFYLEEDSIVFGEMTFTPSGGITSDRGAAGTHLAQRWLGEFLQVP